MAELTALNTLTLGNTFGTWYARTNDVIRRLNVLKTASITGGDGIIITPDPSIDGGFTIEIDSSISKNITFDGNVTILGSLNAAFSQNVSGVNISVPYNSGVTLGNIVYVDSSGNAQLAIADDECTAEVLGVVIGFTGAEAQIATAGKVSGDAVISNFLGSAGATLQKGVVYFLSEGISGAGTTIEPSVSEYVSRPVLLGLTANAGLILPYRGFIATYGLSASSNTTSGVCAGVSSINSSASRLLKFASGPVNNNRIRTDGDVFAVTTFNNLAKTVNYTIVPTRSLDATNYNQKYPNFLLQDIVDSQDYIQENSTFGNLQTTETDILPSESQSAFIYSTSGLTSDVWRIKQIKITIVLAPPHNHTVLMCRMINRLSSTNYINYLGLGEGAAHAAPTILKINMGACALNPNAVLGIPVTGYKEINLSNTTAYQAYSGGQLAFTPLIISPYKTNYGTPRPTGDGLTAGSLSYENDTLTNITQDSSGVHSIIYGQNEFTYPDYNYYDRNSANCRTYVWDVHPTDIGGSSDIFANQYLVQALEGTNYSSSASGATLDTSIIGWNTTYGGVPESLFIALPVVNYVLSDSVNKNFFPYHFNVIVSLKRYDINTQVESDLLIINKDIKSSPLLQTNIVGYDTVPYRYST